ncbi:MAG TPA: hypothetical protein VF978_08725 [Gemmatimonadales bacterium]
MAKRPADAAPPKGMTRRRRISAPAARRAARVKLQKTDPKQAIRQSGRRRGGR